MVDNQSTGLDHIQNKIHTIRGVQVMLDRDLAKLYGVSVKRLNEQVKRNLNRFPINFMFKLTNQELKLLGSQIATSSWGGRRYLPYVFTEQGVASLSSVLRSRVAVEMSIKIINSFISMKKFLQNNFNSQYEPIIIEEFSRSHDGFLIIDQKEVYHIGASLKDLGKKWFAFSKFDIDSFDLLERL